MLEPGLGHVLRNGVRRQLQSPRRRQAIQAYHVAELRNKAAPGRPVHRPAVALTAVSIDVAPNRETKDVAGLVRIAELRQRKPELRCPAERVDLGRDLPHAVPGVVFLLIVPVHRVVTLHPARVHRELEAGAAVVVGVDHDLDLVTADAGVAAGEEPLDAVRMRVERSDKHVEIVLVVGDLGLGREARIRILTRLELPEVLDDRRLVPYLVIVFAVDHRRRGGALRHRGGGVPSRRGRRRGCCLQSQDDGCERHQRHHAMSPGIGYSFDGTIRQMVGFVIGCPVRQP